MRLPKPRAPGLAASISSRTMPGSAQAQSDRTAGSAPSSSGRSRRISGDASSRSTQPHRWRSANAVVPEMMIAVHHKGTEGSNPSPSREESCANPVLPAQGACLRANARTKTAAQPHVLTGMAGFSSGGWLMPRLIRAAVGGAPPAATLRGHQWVEPDSEAVTEEQTAEEPALPSANVIRQVGVFCQ